MSKSKIITIIVVVPIASFISEARAQGPYLDIYVNNKYLINGDDIPYTGLPTVERRITQKEIDDANAAAILAQKAAVAKKAISYTKDNRTDFTNIYVSAGERFGINWRILAAVHSVETGQRGDTQVRSYAGAQGPMQFIPSTFRAYAIDGDGDGSKNINDVDDAIYTAANYLSQNAKIGGIDNALYRYNHSWSYVNKVKSIAGI